MIGEPGLRFYHKTDSPNDETLRKNADMIEERMELALRIERYYNQRTSLQYFNIGDFVLRKVFQSAQAINSKN